MDHYADEIDRAAAISEEHNAECVEAARRAAAPEQTRLPDGSWETTECVDCGEDIEPGRLDMGKVRCFSCQSELEHVRKQYAR